MHLLERGKLLLQRLAQCLIERIDRTVAASDHMVLGIADDDPDNGLGFFGVLPDPAVDGAEVDQRK